MEADTARFFKGVRNSDLEEIQDYLDRGVSVNSKEEENTALQFIFTNLDLMQNL